MKILKGSIVTYLSIMLIFVIVLSGCGLFQNTKNAVLRMGDLQDDALFLASSLSMEARAFLYATLVITPEANKYLKDFEVKAEKAQEDSADALLEYQAGMLSLNEYEIEIRRIYRVILEQVVNMKVFMIANGYKKVQP